MSLPPTINLFPAADLPAPFPDARGGPLPGSVSEQFVKCGKAECRCRTGERHGPYFYRTWREGLTTHKVYVKPSEVAQVRARCARHRAIAEEFRALSIQAEALTARLCAQAARSRRRRAALRRAIRARGLPGDTRAGGGAMNTGKGGRR